MCANYKIMKRSMFMEKGGQIYFDEPSYEEALIGETDDGKVVYDYYGMIESLMKNEGMSDEDASDFISYNTIRFAPYLKDRAPLVVDQSYATDLDGLKENCEQEVRYPEAVLGLDLVQTKVVYDYDKLLGVVEKENDWDEETARNYIIETLIEEGLVVVFVD